MEGASMNILKHKVLISIAIVITGLANPDSGQAQTVIKDRFTEVNGVRLHYLIAGKGDLVLLLHGYAENSHMWRPLMVEVAKTHTVIAPDLRGFGQSSNPTSGYDKKTMAQDVHASHTSY